MKDLISDVKLGLGISREDKQFIRRTNQMKNYIKDNTGEHHIMGHSLGGSIGTSMLAKSKTIRDNVKSANFYNTGYTPAFHKELTTGMTPKIARELNKKITHHHVIGDPISMFLGSGAVGKVKKYQNNIVNPLDKHSINFFSR
jgi:predicted alpha/beta superfamily hydrolase